MTSHSNLDDAALVIHPDGRVTDVVLGKGADNHLAVMYREIGCQHVDVVALTTTIDMWLDDEGLYTQEHNPIATALAESYGFTSQPYFGPVLLCSHRGATVVNLSRDQITAIRARLNDRYDPAG